MAKKARIAELKSDLGAILFSDIKGFSRLTPDETRLFVHKVLPKIGKAVAEYRDNLVEVNTWGDGMFLTSKSPVDLANLALKVRDIFRQCDWPNEGITLPLEIRMALHAGQLIQAPNPIKGPNVKGHFGTELNTCARIEPITPSNKIFATESFKKLVEGQKRANIIFDPIGSCTLPKEGGTVSLYHLRWKDEQAYTTPPHRPEDDIQVRSWINQAERHDLLHERLRRCQSEENVRFISITGRSLLIPAEKPAKSLLEEPFPRAIKNQVTFKGIVLDPKSGEAVFRSSIESPEAKSQEERLLQVDAREVANIRQKYKEAGIAEDITRQHLKLKYTKRGLAFSLWLFNDLALIEPYHFGKRPSVHHLCEFSQLIIPRFSESGIPYELLESHFANLWNDPEAKWLWQE